MNMKTKYLISALALPALLAACVNDDFETQQLPSSTVESDLLKGRAMGELMLSAQKVGYGEQTDTRVDGGMEGASGGINWWWQPGDQLGAVVVDYAGDHRNHIVDATEDYLLTNFPFNAELTEPARGANFSTPTAVVEGGYFFYNQYDGENIQRGNISHVLPQYVDVEYGREAGLSQVGTDKENGANFFISPITKVAVKDADGETLRTPISLTSIYSVLQLRFNLELRNEFVGKDVKIYKVELENGEGDKNFKNTFVLNPATLAKVQYDVWQDAKKNNEAYESVFVQPDGQEKVAMIDATNLEQNRTLIEEAMNAVLAKLQDPASLENCFKEGENKLIYQLKEPYSFQDHDNATMDLMVLIPSDTYELNQTKYAQGRDGAKKGILEMTVYTSEGIYRSYVITEDGLTNWGQSHPDEYVKDQFTFKRGSKTNVTRTIKIGGDVSNVTTYDFTTTGFPVATQEDWNYAIDYLKEHTGQFGGGQGGSDGNDWNFPILNLSNYGGKPIVVDAGHYFPDMRVIYRGDAVLKLEGQSEYVLNPRNMIFGNDEKDETKARPTLLIEDQPEATVVFADVEVENAKDGENYTDAWKLESDAKIHVAESQNVTFEMLKSHTALNIAKGGNVVVTDDATDATLTEGTVTLAEGDKETETKFTVGNEYMNNAVLTINKYALATLNKEVTNNGTVNVIGNLDGNAVFTNAETGVLNVKAWSVSMNDKSRGIATLAAARNDGTINLEERKQDYSGTYGGELTIEQLFDNRGEVMVEGILTAGIEPNGNLHNTGLIQLGRDPYAQIIVKNSYSEAENTGKIVLLAPEEYEFYDNYYLKGEGQKLSTYNGVIEAILDNETYKKVMTNYDQYTSQERAWEVINKVIVVGKLEVNDNVENVNKDFVLNADASIDIAADVTVASLTAVGTGTAITTANNAAFKVNEKVAVEAAADLTVAEGVTLMLQDVDDDADFDAPMLDIVGTLVNNGSIDTKDGETEANNIYTVIRQGGVLDNNGYLSKKAELKYDETAFNELKELVLNLWNETDQGNGCVYRGTWGAGPRVDLVMNTTPMQYNDQATWESYTTNAPDNAVNQERLEYILDNGVWSDEVVYNGQTFKTLVAVHPNNDSYSYLLYLPEENMTEEMTDIWKEILADEKYSLSEGVLFSNYNVNGTWFYAHNYGQLDLSAEGSGAWGEVWQMSRTAGVIGSLNQGMIHPFDN